MKIVMPGCEWVALREGCQALMNKSTLHLRHGFSLQQQNQRQNLLNPNLLQLFALSNREQKQAQLVNHDDDGDDDDDGDADDDDGDDYDDDDD